MKTPLVKIKIASPYPTNTDKKVDLPERNAKCTPDTKKAVLAIAKELETLEGKLVLSDMFRSYDMQLQSHMDFVNKKKKAFSPAPGGSLHEAGRAFDLDLSKIKITLSKFWEIAAKYGVYPIIDKPDSKKSEAWHFDCQGSHRIVSQYYKAGKANNLNPYTAMAASGILSIGVKVDQFAGKEKEASIQSGLIRLGYDIGNIDGQLGKRSKAGLASLKIPFSDTTAMLAKVEAELRKKFPGEYASGADAVILPSNLFT